MHKLMSLATAFMVIGCGGGAKQSSQRQPPTNEDFTVAAETTGSETTTTEAAPPAPEAPKPPDTGGYKLVPPSGLTYAPLDPSNSGGPEAAVVHGDLKSGGTFFLKFTAAVKPGVHTHTADYHAILVSGKAKHWLPGGEKKAKVLEPGSYWFQPGGQPHGDECVGADPCVLYVVMTGAHDFAPAPKAKAGKPGKYKLVARKDMKFAPLDPKQPDGMKLAALSGDPTKGGAAFVLEIPAGGNSGAHSHSGDYQALVLDGAPAHWLPHEKEGEPVAAGTFWFQPGGYDHTDKCTGTTPCHAFLYMDKALDMKPAATK